MTIIELERELLQLGISDDLYSTKTNAFCLGIILCNVSECVNKSL